MRPYAGIIRIRFMGMISAMASMAPLQIVMSSCRTDRPSLLLFNYPDLIKLRPVLARKIDLVCLRFVCNSIQHIS